MAGRLTAQNIIEVGKRLIQAKSLVNHGQWQDWLELNFQLTDRTAQRFMQISERFSKCVDVDGFKPSQLTEMLSLPSAEETEKFIAEKLREGQEIGKLVLLAEARLGELFNQMPKAKENQYTKSGISSCEEKANLETEKPKPKMEVAAEMGFNKNQVAQFQKLADNPDAVQKAIDDAQITAEQVTFAKIKLGELLAALPTQSGARTDLKPVDTAVDRLKPKAESIAELGITQKQAERLQQMAKNPEAVQSAYDRSILALKLKPVIAAKAKEQQIRKPAESVLQKSAEQKPIDTRQEIAKAAGVSDKLTCSLPHFTSEKLKPR